MSNITELPTNIIEEIFYSIIYDIYNNCVNNNLLKAKDDVIVLRNIHTTCKQFKEIIESVINYLYCLNKNILMELYEYNFSPIDLNIITKYMYCMKINIQQKTIEDNNIIIYLIDNHYYYKPEYAVFDTNYLTLLKTLLNLKVDPNEKNIYGNTALLYNFKLIQSDDSDDIEHILFSTINAYLEYDIDLDKQDINGNTVLHIIMQIFCQMISYEYYPQRVYDQIYEIVKKIKGKYNKNIENNKGKNIIQEFIGDSKYFEILKFLMS